MKNEKSVKFHGKSSESATCIDMARRRRGDGGRRFVLGWRSDILDVTVDSVDSDVLGYDKLDPAFTVPVLTYPAAKTGLAGSRRSPGRLNCKTTKQPSQMGNIFCQTCPKTMGP